MNKKLIITKSDLYKLYSLLDKKYSMKYGIFKVENKDWDLGDQFSNKERKEHLKDMENSITKEKEKLSNLNKEIKDFSDKIGIEIDWQ